MAARVREPWKDATTCMANRSRTTGERVTEEKGQQRGIQSAEVAVRAIEAIERSGGAAHDRALGAWPLRVDDVRPRGGSGRAGHTA